MKIDKNRFSNGWPVKWFQLITDRPLLSYRLAKLKRGEFKKVVDEIRRTRNN